MTRNTKETMRAAIYLRVSTDEQNESGLGLASQEERCRALILAKGWELAGIYRDGGVSGTMDPKDRPESGRMLVDAQAGAFDLIVVLKLDRLARRAEWIHRTLRELDEAGIGFTSVSEPVDTSSAMGKAFLGISAVFAELERNLIAERTRAALGVKKTRGERLGTPHLGIRVHEGAAITVPEEVETVTRIQALRAQGRSLRQIVAQLEGEGRKTKRGGKWAPNTVSYILKAQGAGAALEGGIQ